MDVLGGNMGDLFWSNSSDLTNFHNHLMQQNLQNASSWDMMHTWQHKQLKLMMPLHLKQLKPEQNST